MYKRAGWTIPRPLSLQPQHPSGHEGESGFSGFKRRPLKMTLGKVTVCGMGSDMLKVLEDAGISHNLPDEFSQSLSTL